MPDLLPSALSWWDSRKAALQRQIADNLGGSLLDALRGAARSGLDMADQAGGAFASLATGGQVGPQGIADKLLPSTETPAEGVGEFLGPPLKTGLKLATFGGMLAKKAPIMQLAKAKELFEQGLSPEEIWKQTGGWVGPEGRTRFEIPDQGARLLPMPPGRFQTSTAVGDVLHHPALYEQYPDTANLSLLRQNTPFAGGSYSDRDKLISLLGPESTQLPTLLHELQHNIQRFENFTPGASPSYWTRVMEKAPEVWEAAIVQKSRELREAGDTRNANRLIILKDMGLSTDPRAREAAANTAYTITGGEVESRNVERRLGRSAQENLEESPEATADTPSRAWLLNALAIPR